MKKLLALIAISAILASNVAYASEVSNTDVETQEHAEINKEEKVEPEEAPKEDTEGATEVKRGSLKMKFEKAKEGLTVTAYKIANVKDGEYILEEEYANEDIDLNNAKDANSLLVLTQKLEKIVKGGVSEKTKSNGEVFFDDLDEGVYLIKTEDDEEYDKVQTVLVSIPTYDEKADDMVYDIEITAKTTPRELVDDPKPVPQTGVSRMMFVFGGIAVIAIIAGVSIGVKKKK